MLRRMFATLPSLTLRSQAHGKHYALQGAERFRLRHCTGRFGLKKPLTPPGLLIARLRPLGCPDSSHGVHLPLPPWSCAVCPLCQTELHCSWQAASMAACLRRNAKKDLVMQPLPASRKKWQCRAWPNPPRKKAGNKTMRGSPGNQLRLGLVRP
jgi:hypothetical protein